MGRRRQWRRRPWGQGPRGPSGPQGSPPDLEDIIRRGQDRLKQALPGGGGASPAHVRPDRPSALVALWLFQSIYTVQPDELAVELRFGKPKDELSEPGLHFHWWPVETVEMANIAEKLIDIGEVARRHVVGPDAFGRPEHRRRAVLGRLPGRRSRGLSVQRRRSRRHGAPGRRKRDARSRRPPSGAGHLPRRPPGHRRRSARDHADDARRLRRRPRDQRDLDRGRGAAARSGRRVRRSAARRAGRRPLRRRIQPVLQPAARPGARRGGADPRRGGRLQEPRRAGSRGRGAALHLGLRRIRQGARRDAQAPVPRNHGEGAAATPTR